jgi:putative nucleotidyltransferase with HDIG domain
MAVVEYSPRILVVDDEPHIRAVIGATLEKNSYITIEAATGTEAMEILNKDPHFDLILTDIMMKGMDGMGLLEQVKLTHPEIPLVMVTAIHDIAVAILAMRKGAYDYLLKPFEREQLLAVIKRALEHRSLVKQNQIYQQNLEHLVAARTEMLNKTMTDLERSYDITLEALGDALDMKDAETEGHSRRVTAFTITLARAMGLSHEVIKVIARGAFLHDIGKMAIPDAILLKSAGLTPEEIFIVQEHCLRGYQILQKIPFLKESAEIVYAHQEHFDGSGYPRGLVGTQIPLGARIFGVADALDAITSNRPYRPARSFEEARAEILRCSGTQFDPSVVEVFLGVPPSLWLELGGEIHTKNHSFSTFDFTSGKFQNSRMESLLSRHLSGKTK